MATTLEQSEKIESLGINERLNDFLQKNRRSLVIGAIGGLILLAGFIAFFLIRDALRAKAVGAVEELTLRYEILLMDLKDPAKEAEVQAFTDELAAFAAKHRGYAGARSYSLLAGIYAERDDWPQAEAAWVKAAAAAPKTYLAPVSFFNAAVAAEEQGNISGAIDLYTKSLALADIFPAASRAQFSIGRLWETQKNNEAALEAYQAVINNWPEEPVWTNFARNRMLVLNGQ
jgi:tetratricopeptide (TPR) repeat protein